MLTLTQIADQICSGWVLILPRGQSSDSLRKTHEEVTAVTLA